MSIFGTKGQNNAITITQKLSIGGHDVAHHDALFAFAMSIVTSTLGSC